MPCSQVARDSQRCILNDVCRLDLVVGIRSKSELKIVIIIPPAFDPTGNISPNSLENLLIQVEIAPAVTRVATTVDWSKSSVHEL